MSSANFIVKHFYLNLPGVSNCLNFKTCDKPKTKSKVLINWEIFAKHDTLSIGYFSGFIFIQKSVHTI